MEPDWERVNEISLQVSDLFDNEEINVILPVLIRTLAFAIASSHTTQKDRLVLYEQVAKVLLDQIVDMDWRELQP